VSERKEESDTEGKSTDVFLEWEDQNEWISLGDPRIQESGLFSS
jgi:hypothetical protein